MTTPREQGRLSVPLLLFPHWCQACSSRPVVAISFTSGEAHTHGGRPYTNPMGAALPALQGAMARDCTNGYDRPCCGKVQRGEPACPKSQGKSMAWPDLGYRPPPPNTPTTTGLYSQQEESVGRVSVSWDSALPSLPSQSIYRLRSGHLPSQLLTQLCPKLQAGTTGPGLPLAVAALALQCPQGAGAGPQTTLR